jgi:hypothetical protein
MMGKAPGVTMKNLWQTDKTLYKKLMGGLYDFEYQRIFKTLHGSGSKTLRLANPDFHDGQVLVDVASLTMTVIDFGQSLPITQSQINFGLDILALITGVKREANSMNLLKDWVNQNAPQATFTQQDFREIMANSDHMDRFVRLIAKLELNGAPLSLEVVHLVLQVNRLIMLGKKVGKYPKVSMGTDLVLREYFGHNHEGGSVRCSESFRK